MANLEFLSGFYFIILFTTFVLAIVLFLKIDKIKELNEKLSKAQSTINQLDEQAKLILQTDLRFTKTQEALDREIEILYTLNKLTRLIGSTLEEKEIFKRLDDSLLIKLGFEKVLIVTKEQDKTSTRLSMGYPEEDSPIIEKHIFTIYNSALKIKKPVCIPDIVDADDQFKTIMENLKLNSLITVPIITKEETVGLVLVGNKVDRRPFVAGDVEIISILANQIAQSLENIKLYEQAWKAQQSLESRIKERTKELTEALSKLEGISKAKSEFVSAVSHELRTPLTSIKGYASILSSGKLGEINAEIKKRLEKINTHSDALTNLINELLDISRIESGRTVMKYEDFKIIDSAKSLHDLFEPQLKENAIKLELNIPKDLTLYADKGQLERALINLLSNALKFTPNKGKIVIGAEEDEAGCIIKVCDTGKGISANDLPHIFDEFYRADNEINAKVKGTGLGLSLVKSIIEALKGSVTCESESMKGTTFTIKLPKKS